MFDEIKALAEKKEYKLLEVKDFPHSDDHYLKVVVAKNKKLPSYVCWIYNSNDKAFYSGFYTDKKETAINKMEARILLEQL